MGKNKKKKAQMFRNFLVFKASQDQPNLYKWSSTSAQGDTSSSFQTPHSEQEKLTELTDDTPPIFSENQPGPSGIASEVSQVEPVNVKPAQQQGKWTALKPAQDASQIQVNMKQDKKRPNLTVVQKWQASKIQLVIDKCQKLSSQVETRPVEVPVQDTLATTPEEPKPNIQPTIPNEQSSQHYEQFSSQQQIEVKGYTPEYQQSIMKSNQNTMGYVTQYPFSNTGIPRTFLTNPNNPSLQLGQTGPVNWAHNNVPGLQINPASPPTSQSNIGSGWPKHKGATKITRQIWNPDIHIYGNSDQQGNVAQGNMAQVGSNSPIFELNEPLKVETFMNPEPPQAYSPSDIYTEALKNEDEETDEGLESPDRLQSGSRRLSAFKRLGPPTEHKKPKLTVNLLLKQDIRAVVDETDDTPTHLKPELTMSSDEIVVKYLESWPWNINMAPLRTVTIRHSKSVMILEQEYMEEAYVKDSRFLQIVVMGYPPSWKKEDVLDAVLESVQENSFIPCFIEFTKIRCRFLVIRCKQALLAIHKYGFVIARGCVELIVSISTMHLNLNNLDFVPRLVLRRIMANRLDGYSLNLSRFTTKSDISHFIYFPLHRNINQIELLQLQSTVPWECLTALDLSHNRISTISGLDLKNSTPKLRLLNLSHNRIASVMTLLPVRNLPLKSIHLEGNPLCNNYIEGEHYIKVLTMLFTGLEEIDGVLFKQAGSLPAARRNYCEADAHAHAHQLVEKLVEVMFPLLDAPPDKRLLLQEMYSEDAVLTLTFMYKLRYSPIYRDYRSLFNRARILDEGDMEATVGDTNIAKVIARWPDLLHDPATFTVDVLSHSDATTIVRIGGIVKITAESLAEEEHLLAFTRTLVLHTRDGCEYKITNEMLYWDVPERSYAETAFKITRVKPKSKDLRLDSPPDDNLKEKLVEVFMKITELDKGPSQRCLEAKDWEIRNALEYFSKLLKLNNLDPIMRDI